MNTNCSPEAHRWVRTLETKPYPGSRKWEYARAVSTCSACGAVSAQGWHRRLRVQRVRATQLVAR